MNVSLELFKQEDLLINGVKYGNLLVEEKEHFIFRKRDLSVFFTERKGLLWEQILILEIIPFLTFNIKYKHK